MPEKYIDLHIHTNASDGTSLPDEVYHRALKFGLAAFAITDHDTLDGYYHIRHIFYKNGGTLFRRMNNDIFNILYGIDKTYPPYEILFWGMFNILSASIGIIGSQGIEDLSEGNIMGDELFGVHQHLVLLYKATETVDLNNPWCGQ